MKRKCPMCAEEIQAKAKMCKHCKSPIKPMNPYSMVGCLVTVALLLLGTYIAISLTRDSADAEPEQSSTASASQTSLLG